MEAGTGEGDEFNEDGREVSGVNPSPPEGRAGDLGGRAGVVVAGGKGRGGKVGEGKPYELVGDMGTELGGPLPMIPLPLLFAAMELAREVVMRDIRRDVGVAGTTGKGTCEWDGEGACVVDWPRLRARPGGGVGLDVIEDGKALFVDENELERE